MVTEKTRAFARRNGYEVYANTDSRTQAWEIRDRLNGENRRHDASIGLQEDDTWAVWYIPQTEHGRIPCPVSA